MNRLFAILLVLCSHLGAAISVVAHRCDSLGANGGTTTAVNTTGATNMAVLCSSYSAGVACTVTSDTGGNTWTGRTTQTSSEPQLRIFNVDSPTTNASHTVTFSSTGGFVSACVIAWSGGKSSGSFDLEGGGVQNSAAGTSVQQSASITPSQANEIYIIGLSFSASNTPAIDSSFGTPDTANYTAGVSEGISMSWKIQTTATARQPIWSWVTGTRGVTASATFEVAPSGGTCLPSLAATGAGVC